MTISKPLVSVIIPVYNAGAFLKPAVESILSQTYQHLEIIVVDDGSTDQAINLLEKSKDPRLIFLKQSNRGKSVAVNSALDIMQGEYWMLQDADDISYPERVARQVEALEADRELAAVFVGIDIRIAGKVIAPRFMPKSTADCREDIRYFRLPAHDATGMYRVSMLKNYRLDPELRIGQGVDLIFRVGERSPIKVIEGCLYSHRINRQSNTHRHSSAEVIRQINLVGRKACQRRGCAFAEQASVSNQQSGWLRHRKYDTITSYAMESVRQLKQSNRHAEALRTALITASLHPFDFLYLKPIVYWLTPLALVKLYSRFKSKVLRRTQHS